MQSITLEKTNLRDFAVVMLASFLICLSGYVSIPLWFTPVPLATQNSMVLLMAALLGSKRGTLATFAFLAQGAMGLPVFSNASAGVHVFFGPTGGYLVGYLIAAFFVGYIAERNKSLTRSALAFLTGNLIVYLFGASYLSTFVGINKAFALGIAPFLIGDFVKTLVSIKILHYRGWKKA